LIDVAIIASLKALIAWVETLTHDAITATCHLAVVGTRVGVYLVSIIACFA
jgi:hypothetical protein